MTIPIDPDMIGLGRQPPAPAPASAPEFPGDSNALFNQMSEAVLCLTPGGDFTYLNPAAERAFGQPASVLIGRNIWKLLPDTVGKPFYLAFQRVRESGGSAQLDQYFSVLGHWYDLTIYRLSGQICIIARDTTASRQAHLRLEILADASRAFSEAGLNLQATFDVVARRLADVLGDTCVVRSLRSDGRAWEDVLGAHDRDPQICQIVKSAAVLTEGDSYDASVLRDRRPILIEHLDSRQLDALPASSNYRRLYAQLQPHSIMVAPMRSGRRLLGTISMCRRRGGNPQPYNRADLVLLSELASRAAMAILNARQYNETLMLEERLRLAMEAAEIGTWDYDPQTRRLSGDERCRYLLGLPLEAPMNCRIFRSTLHPEDAERVDSELKRALAGEGGGEFNCEFRAIGRDDGQMRWLAANGRAFFHPETGRLHRATGTLLDISREKAAESERERHLRELERNLRFSDMFVGILGHDLRNPLSAIVSSAQLLQRRADSERLSVPAERIVSSAMRMQRMIDQLLDLTRIRLGGGLPITRQRLDLARLCEQVSGELAASGCLNPMTLEAWGDTHGYWDRDRLWQLLSNIASNAFHHSPPGSTVQILIDGSDDSEVQLEVHNEGEVPRELLANIFEPLKHSARREAGSSGLGLGMFISHQIVLAHQGRISVSSGPEEGTRVVVCLPRQAEQRQDAALLRVGND